MASLKTFFETQVTALDHAFEQARIDKNKKHLSYIILLFAGLQAFYFVVKFIRYGYGLQSEIVFNGVFIFLTLAVYVLLNLGDELFFRVGLFLTLMVSALYSWYGSVSGLGEFVYLLMLILCCVFIIDGVGIRIASVLSGLIYILGSIAQWQFTLTPLGHIIAVMILIGAIWIKSERTHFEYNTSHQNMKTIGALNKQIEFEKDYREVVTERLMESEHKLRVFMNRVPAAIIILDEGRITYANSGAVEMTGYSKEELERTDWIELLDFEDAIMFHDVLSNEDWEAESYRDYSVRILCKDGKPVWTKLVVTDIKYGVKTVKLITGFSISDEKHYESQLNKLVKMKEDMLVLTQSILGIDDLSILFDIILDNAVESIEMADRGSILLVGEDGTLRAEAYRGYAPDLMKDFSLPIEESFLYIKTAGLMQSTEIINDISRLSGVKMTKAQKSGLTEVQSTIAAPIYFGGNLYGMIYLDSPLRGAFKDEDFMMVDFLKTQVEMAISKQALMDETVYLSRYDKLTGVFNRRWFEEYYHTMEAKAVRYGDGFALVMFDLDGLKKVNDTYGHLLGDKLIKGFVDRLKLTVRTSDVLARFGGDEFIGVFHEIDTFNLEKRMRQLQEMFISSPIIASEHKIYCRFSYGAAFFNEDSNNYESLVKLADERMYAMKSSVNKSYVEKVES